MASIKRVKVGIGGKHLECSGCGRTISWADVQCETCRRHLGFPNVRAAQEDEEVSELEKRYVAAQESCEARGCKANLDDFEAALIESKAVICRGLGEVATWINEQDRHYKSFYLQVHEDGRVPELNEFDRDRSAVDERLFPLFKEQICFASLALPDTPFNGFGAYRVTLRSETIAERSSVFWGNTYFFSKNKGVQLTGPLPRGYQTVWADRAKLCCAKLHAHFDKNTRAENFGEILAMPEGDGDPDFVEVHIYGDLRRECVAEILGPRSKDPDDVQITNRIRKSVRAWGARAEFK